MQELVAFDQFPVLFIAGADHIENFARLLAEGGFHTDIIVRDWEPSAVKDWEIIADNLRERGYNIGWRSVSTSTGQRFVADARSQEGKRFVVEAEDMLAAFMALCRNLSELTRRRRPARRAKKDCFSLLRRKLTRGVEFARGPHYIKQLDGAWGDIRPEPRATRRCVLTGTPFPRTYADAFNLFDTLWPQTPPKADDVAQTLRGINAE